MEPDLFTATAEERQEKGPGGQPPGGACAPHARRGRGPAAPAEARPRCAGWSARQRPRRTVLGSPVGPPRHQQDHPGVRRVPRLTNKRFVELSAITAVSVKRSRAVIDGARRATGGIGARRPSPLPGRDPPASARPNGAPCSGRGEPLGDPDRGHHGEPLLLGVSPAALPAPSCSPLRPAPPTTTSGACSGAR
ncbi:hypothetical protein LT493_31185 [Streptomyces tricolor]|nr:hypothetical protein [Streptomyces tricolor]